MKISALGRPALAGAILLASLTTHAASVTHGFLSTNDDGSSNIITDSLNGLEYLRLDVLKDLTYQQTVDVLDTQDGGGWAIANSDIALGFAAAVLGGSATCTHNGTSVSNAFCGSLSPWAEGDLGANFNADGDYFWFSDDAGGVDAWKILNDGQTSIFDLGSTANSDEFAAGGSNSGVPISWLVYRASPVPVPAAGWLFMSALLGLVGRKQLLHR